MSGSSAPNPAVRHALEVTFAALTDFEFHGGPWLWERKEAGIIMARPGRRSTSIEHGSPVAASRIFMEKQGRLTNSRRKWYSGATLP